MASLCEDGLAARVSEFIHASLDSVAASVAMWDGTTHGGSLRYHAHSGGLGGSQCISQQLELQGDNDNATIGVCHTGCLEPSKCVEGGIFSESHGTNDE